MKGQREQTTDIVFKKPERTRFALTTGQLGAVITVVAAGVLGWARIDSRLNNIERRLGRLDSEVAVFPSPVATAYSISTDPCTITPILVDEPTQRKAP